MFIVMTTRRSLRLAAVACVAGLAGVACGGASGGDEQSASVESSVGSTVTGTATVPASLQFTAPLIGGGEIVGDELAGKPTAFWFWSPT